MYHVINFSVNTIRLIITCVLLLLSRSYSVLLSFALLVFIHILYIIWFIFLYDSYLYIYYVVPNQGTFHIGVSNIVFFQYIHLSCRKHNIYVLKIIECSLMVMWTRRLQLGSKQFSCMIASLGQLHQIKIMKSIMKTFIVELKLEVFLFHCKNVLHYWNNNLSMVYHFQIVIIIISIKIYQVSFSKCYLRNEVCQMISVRVAECPRFTKVIELIHNWSYYQMLYSRSNWRLNNIMRNHRKQQTKRINFLRKTLKINFVNCFFCSILICSDFKSHNHI